MTSKTQENSLSLLEVEDALGNVRDALSAVADILTFMKYDDGADIETVCRFLGGAILQKKEFIESFISTLGKVRAEITA